MTSAASSVVTSAASAASSVVSGAAVRVIAGLAGLVGLAGCPDPAENAPTLWLALDGRETEVKLIDHEPPPY